MVIIVKDRPSNPSISINFFFLLPNRLNNWNIMKKRYDLYCNFVSLKTKYVQMEHSPQTHFKGCEINITCVVNWFQSAEAEEQLIESLNSKPNSATGREMEVSWGWNASSNDIWGIGMFDWINFVVSCNILHFHPFRSGRRNTSSSSMRWVEELEEFQVREKVALWREFCYAEQNYWCKYWRTLLSGTQSILLNQHYFIII